MRLRTKVEYPTTVLGGPLSVIIHDKTNGSVSGPHAQGNSSTMVLSEDVSTIEDDISPGRITKRVVHNKVQMNKVNPSSIDEQTTNTRYVVSGNNCHWWSWGNYGAISGANILVSYPRTIAELQRQAKHAFMNRNEVDNLLNIIESPQLIASLRSLADLRQRFSTTKLVRSLKVENIRGKVNNKGFIVGKAKAIINNNVRVGKVVSKLKSVDASNLHLMWSFGFSPLLSDMKKIMASVKTIKSDLDRYTRQAGKPYVCTARCLGSLSLTGMNGVTGWSATEPYVPDNTFWHTSLVGRAEMLVGVRGRRSIDYNSDSFKKLDYLMSRFLSPGPVSLLWETIPYSFVVDWFVDLSGIIDTLNNTLTGDTKQITDQWTSEKWVARVNSIKHRTQTWATMLDGTVTTTTMLQHYHRDPLTNSNAIGLSNRFGKKQALLTVSLLHQLVANLRTR